VENEIPVDCLTCISLVNDVSKHGITPDQNKSVKSSLSLLGVPPFLFGVEASSRGEKHYALQKCTSILFWG
jgi:hypothetical protein